MGLAAAKKRFEKDYQEQEEILTVLTNESVGGAYLYEKGIWVPSAGLLAWVDGEGTFHRAAPGQICSLSWLVEEQEQHERGWGYNLKALSIYQVRCRKNLHTSSWLLLEVLGRDLEHPALEEVLADYKRPVTFTDPLCGEFALDRQFSWFACEMDWAGERCLVYLECDEEDGETAEAALAAFKPIDPAAADWDRRFRAFAAQELAELASDWQDTAVTEEDFARRISISEFSMDPEGTYTAYYDDGDLFFGHVIVITGDEESGPEDAEIAG